MSSYLCLSATLGKQLEMTAIVPEMESVTDTRSQSSVYDTSLSIAMRKKLNIYGLTPPQPETYKIQKARCFAQLSQKKTNIEKYQYLLALKHSNVHLFYRIVTDHFCELAPLVYTPVVGEACQRWSEIYQNPEGLYISYRDKGRIAEVVNNWPQENVEISVITDGSRILGLGDLGIGGMGIAVGKLILYTACAGIRPERVLPLTVDTGTNNSSLRSDPLYLGHRSEKISFEEEQELLDEVMETLVRRWPNILIQFEDWKNPFPSLARYAPKYAMFNDDVQGTGAVIMGGIISAVKESGVAPKDHRAVFFGAGSAGVGVAQQIVEYFKQQGLSEKEAKEVFWFVDTKGLITMDRGDEKLAEHKIYFARNDNDGQQFKTLEEVLDFVKPTILMGLSTIGGAFGESILQKMARWNDRPIIFPLSNPISKSECTYEDAIVNTDGRVLFASGSPFDPVTYQNKTYHPSQGNNMYVFPGIGLGSIICKASRVTASMIFAAGEAVPSKLSDAERKDGLMYPRLTRIREVSSRVALRVIRAAQKENVDDEPRLRAMSDTQLESLIQARMYKPHSFLEEGVSGMA